MSLSEADSDLLNRDLLSGSKSPAKNDVSVKILSNGKVLKVQKTRQRKILSCIYCHSKKIKCSRVLPTCNNCEKLGLTCQYFANDRVSKGGKNKRRLDSGVDNLTDPNLSSNNSDTSIKNEDFLDHLLPKEPQVQVPSGNNINGIESLSSNFPNISKSLLQTPLLNNINNNITNSYFSNNPNNNEDKEDLYSFNLSSFTFANYQSQSNNKNNQLLKHSQDSNPSLHFQQSENLSNFNSHSNSSTNISSLFAKNPTHIYPQNGVSHFGDLKPNEPTDASSLHQISSHYLNSSSFELLNHLDNTKNFLNGTNTYYDNQNVLEDLETHLPSSKEKSYELIERYLNSVHNLLPIVTNIDDFVSEHDKYWNDCNPYDRESNNSLTDFNFIQFYTLYFPILYAATISEFEEFDNLLLNQDINKYLKGFNKICQYYNYPHGLKTIPLLLGNVLIQSTSPNPSTMEMSQIIRYAKFLQMNKDPETSLKIKDPLVIKFRRLLWWTIFGLDCLTSHNFCLPPVCRFDDFNVLLPDDEEPIHNNSNEVVSSHLNISILSMNIKFKYDRILNELMYQLHSDKALNITSAKVNELKVMINDYFEYIHLSINKMNLYHEKYPPKTVNEINMINFLKNHSFSYVDRALMLLHKKFLLSEHEVGVDGSEIIKQPSGFRLNDLIKLADQEKLPNKKRQLVSSEGTANSHKYSESSVESNYNIHLTKPRNGVLSFNQFEDTFQALPESNMLKNFYNFDKLQINLNLNVSKFNNFSYTDLNNNLIPSLLHNLNDFLKYNDFLKFGKFNWYVKRTIPLDSIILLFTIMIVKFKFQMMNFNELLVYVKLINKSLFILNRKWFKNEKYKRMLSLTNLVWEFVLKKFRILQIINKFTDSNFLIVNSNKNKFFNKYQYFNHQLTGYLNTAEIFKTMKVAQPMLSIDLINKLNNQRIKYLTNDGTASLSNSLNMSLQQFDNYNYNYSDASKPKVQFEIEDDNIPPAVIKYDDTNLNLTEPTEVIQTNEDFLIDFKILGQFSVNDLDNNELVVLKDKIAFDLRNNYVDINDYCAFYISLENILQELINFIE